MPDGSPQHLPEPSLGAALTEARAAAGLSVDDVSSVTRIRATLVRDLEAGRTGSSGAPVYARGHVRAIAAALHADPVPLVALLDAQVGRPEPLVTAAPTGRITGFGGSTLVPPPARAVRERRGPRWGVAVTVAAAVLVVVSYVGLQSPRPPAASVGAAPVATAAPGARRPVRTPAPDSVASVPAAAGAQLRVRLIGGSSWVSVHNAGATLFEGVLASGQFKEFTDPTRLRVVLGNAGAVDLNCGGHDSGPAGGSGKVLRFSCTKDGLAPA